MKFYIPYNDVFYYDINQTITKAVNTDIKIYSN